MVEVFKTSVTAADHAKQLLDQLLHAYPHYKANFDLSDCDHILRVVHADGPVFGDDIIEFVRRFGYEAEVLTDMIPAEYLFAETLSTTTGYL
jgi:hypothetical protein